MTTKKPIPHLPIDLDDDLRLRLAESDDAEALVTFRFSAQRIENILSGHHPTMTIQDYIIVEDTRTDQIVSGMCMIPQTWTYGGIAFPCVRPE